MNRCPKISIVVLNYNGKEVIKNCLNSLFKMNYPNFEVIVVDNNSSDGSLELAKANFPRAVFIKNEENLGFSAGNNMGIRYALEHLAEYVLLLNNDTEVEYDFLRKIIGTFATDKKIGIVSPVIMAGNSKKIWFAGGKINWLTMKTKHENNIENRDFYDTDFISGCAMLVRAEVFGKIGLLDEDYFLYWEDADFSVRAKKAGFRRIIAARSQIKHFEKSELKRTNKIYWLVISGLIFFKKNSPLYFKPWISAYVFLRKIKNKIDMKTRKNEIVEAVHKAYDDFKYAKI